MEIDIERFKKKFEPMIINKMAKTNTPGFAITIKQNDNIIYQRGFGSRDLLNSLPYNTDTLNGFGSNTKSFTALAILLLEQEGKLSIDDPISKYLPITIGKENYPILIRHLMSHSSGLPNLGTAEITLQQYEPSLPFPLVPYTGLDDLYNHVNAAGDELIYKPGEHFYYCNVGYTLLGELITSVSGKDYADFIKERILIPLSMTRSGFTKEDVENEENLSVPYISLPIDNPPNKPRISVFPFHRFIYSAGGLISSTNEMMNYISMMLNEGNFDGKQVYSSEIINNVISPQVEIGPDMGGGTSHYAFGWSHVTNFLGDSLIQHSGGITGGLSYMGYLKEHKIAITSISNFGMNPTEDAYMTFCYLLNKNPGDVFPFVNRNKHLSKFVGEYQTYKFIIIRKIIFENGLLFVIDPDVSEFKFPLLPKSDKVDETHFYVQTPALRMDVDFIENEQGIHFNIERNQYHKI